MNGIGLLKVMNKYEYEGAFVNGVKHGQAKWKSSNGQQY